ncbi:50S ribosomal protein L10 [Culicoidibacter larvae]|uniref:Large ribosomal subunit protein uL10 n=1 Tax=Culicoidibacter larvae TaxID=2579976 RepID=A0A5R8QGY4_9FIRM|nr:50S ribosomal protein L10 [Culicoidibacter larvae]TLG77289.1 50S ribosomal protein L10 [Culicoidibacter larvae]
MANAQAVEQKQQLVNEVTDKMNASQSTIVVDYRGLSVGEVTQLRRNLREAGVEFKVYKNNLVRRAAESLGYEGLNEHLTGPNAIAFSNEDVVAPAKVLSQFAKEHEALEIKTGVIEGKVVDLAVIKELASLPSRDGLLSMLLSVLQAPVRGLAVATNAIAEQKEEA